MGFQFDVMLIDSFMDDVTYVRDVEVCVERMIFYIPRCMCYGSENFGLGSPLGNMTNFCYTFLTIPSKKDGISTFQEN